MPQNPCIAEMGEVMSKIPFLRRDEASDEQRRIATPIYEARGVKSDVYGNPYGILLHFPELAERASNLGSFLRDAGGGTLSKRVSELVIALTAQFWNCQYEWSVHYQQALDAGLDPAVIEAIRLKERPKFGRADEEIAYDYAIQLYANRGIDDTLHRKAVDAFGEKGTICLVAIAGYYSLLALVCNAFDLQVTRVPPPPPLKQS
jgi:4-carboxymuconolactone decarboxylase